MKKTPFVISLIGLSSSGKTTLGNRLYTHLREEKLQSLQLIDGDNVRDFLRGKIGYTPKDRKLSAAIQTQLAYSLYEHGISSIVCNISPFEESRIFARQKIPCLVEVYVKCSLETCIDRDRKLGKNVYKPVLEGATSNVNVVGVDIDFEEPLSADITLNTEIEDTEDSFSRLIEYLAVKLEYSMSMPLV